MAAGPSGAVFLRELFVTDEAVDPEIGDLDDEFVFAFDEGVGDIHAEGFLPEDSERFSVEGGLGEVLHISKVEEDS
jgi:hypothetical protein